MIFEMLGFSNKKNKEFISLDFNGKYCMEINSTPL